jgi:anti-sigma factor RsiW
MNQKFTCRELVELVTEYLELALPEDERQRFEKHLHGCTGCKTYVQHIQQTRSLVGSLRDAELPVEQRNQLIELFRQWQAVPEQQDGYDSA